MFAEIAGQSANAVIDRLGLAPLAGEGGYWKAGPRTENLNSILFLMTPEGFSAMHLLTVTEGWQWLAGDACRMVQLRPNGTELELELGPAWTSTIVEAGVWQGAKTSGKWTLVSCWCAPAFTDQCFTLGERESLVQAYPAAKTLIEELTR